MGLPGLNQDLARINVPCSRTQHSDASEARTADLGLESSTLPLNHCAPSIAVDWDVKHQKKLKELHMSNVKNSGLMVGSKHCTI